MQAIKKWFNRYLSEPEAVFIVVALAFIIFIFSIMGNILLPIVASIVIAYILSGFVERFDRCKCPHVVSVTIIFLLFIGLFLVFFIWFLPLIFQQLGSLFAEFPHMLTRGQKWLVNLQAVHPDLFSAGQLKYVLSEASHSLSKLGQFLVSFSIASIGNVITAVVYLVLVPLLTFFFMKDKREIVTWMQKFLPKKHPAITKIWQEVNGKIGDYIRGKIIEIIIVAVVTIPVFTLMGLQYGALLGLFVGLSVLIPYIGITVVTIPIVLIAFFQWGFSAHLLYLLIIYAVIAILDGNVLAPILFSEKVKLHPVVIVVAVLVFGFLWGFWGVFFAIPLATLVNALIKEWPVK